jgi:hypothetical protein
MKTKIFWTSRSKPNLDNQVNSQCIYQEINWRMHWENKVMENVIKLTPGKKWILVTCFGKETGNEVISQLTLIMLNK